MGGISLLDSGPEGFAATVFLADGATPAFAARADFFPLDGRYRTAQGIADASGRLTWTGLGRSQSDDPETGPEPLKEPTVAAWMPGLSGPVVATVEPGKPLRLVLPAPAGVSGRVTLGGREIGGRDARVRAVVAAEARGALAAPFGREVIGDMPPRHIPRPTSIRTVYCVPSGALYAPGFLILLQPPQVAPASRPKLAPKP
jgi:hypothetical protein